MNKLLKKFKLAFLKVWKKFLNWFKTFPITSTLKKVKVSVFDNKFLISIIQLFVIILSTYIATVIAGEWWMLFIIVLASFITFCYIFFQAYRKIKSEKDNYSAKMKDSDVINVNNPENTYRS